MKTILIIIILLVVSAQYILSQVGINSLSVNGMALYIEGGNNTTEDDDVIVDNEGNVGIGMIPASKLSVKGNLNYPYNNPSRNKVLVSDANGFASWTHLALGRNTSAWQLSNNVANVTFNYRIVTPLIGTSTVLSNDEIGLKAVTNGVIIPAGRYLLMVSGDIAYREYGSLYVYNGTAIVLQVYYGEGLNTAIAYTEFNNPTTLTLSYMAIDPSVKNTAGNDFYLKPPYQQPYSYTIRLLQLN